ncbi:MAG: EscU/YscU/HrcU family type III secretion system export apparatus switch protein [Treponema sp.]|nr:EscU/YscU/HrcU family type III secretion system export apparatus switch protein [Treponema sp.]
MGLVELRQTAVALKYPQGAELPFITAKGKGQLAEKIIEIARDNDIYIEENAPLVDLLSIQEVNDAVPEEAFEALALIFAFVLEREGKAGAGR